ncbi:MAG: hypothetical protein JRI73_14355 [Deltaproteobacteria bacterium]|nr:hypothetical protein [Deltaproteobacteria bacterium]
MFKKFYVILAIAVLCSGLYRSADAREKVIWPYICFYPIYICDNDKLVGGAGLEIYHLIWENMPEYKHESVLLPVKRFLKDMKEGKHYLFWGLYRTPEREKYLYFSIPCRISTPTMVVIRKDDLERFGGGKAVSLKALLDDKALRFLIFDSISFGSGVDELLKKYEKAENVYTEYRTDQMNQHALDLLLKKRIDYFLKLNGTRHIAIEMGIADEIVFIPIEEQTHYKVGHIVAPKNEWGKQMIKKVNQVLRKQIPTETFFQFFTPLVSENLVPDLRQQFNELISRKAAKKKI